MSTCSAAVYSSWAWSDLSVCFITDRKWESSADLCCDDSASIKETTSCAAELMMCGRCAPSPFTTTFQPIAQKRPLCRLAIWGLLFWRRREFCPTYQRLHETISLHHCLIFNFPSHWAGSRSKRDRAAGQPGPETNFSCKSICSAAVLFERAAADGLHVVSVCGWERHFLWGNPLQGKGRGNGGSWHTKWERLLRVYYLKTKKKSCV